MPVNRGMFSTGQVEWETPKALFDKLDEEFGFTVDVCATDKNAKCDCYYTANQDGLAQDWTGRCWMNPPYGTEIDLWVQKAYESSRDGATVVCLLPARPDTAWWQDYCMKGEIRFIRGRIKFVGADDYAPFPSAVVIFRPYHEPAEVAMCTTWSYRSVRNRVRRRT